MSAKCEPLGGVPGLVFALGHRRQAGLQRDQSLESAYPIRPTSTANPVASSPVRAPRDTRRGPLADDPAGTVARRGCNGPRRGRAAAGSPRGIPRSHLPPSPGPSGHCRGCSGPRRSRARSRMASRYSAIASSSFPWASRAIAETGVGLGEVGLEPDRLAVLGDRLGRLPLPVQGGAEVGVGLGDVGPEPDRLAVFGDRLGQLPLVVRARPRLMWAPGRRA